MRLVTFELNGSSHAGMVEADQVVELPYPDVGTMLAASENWRAEAGRTGPHHDLSAVRLLPVVPAPSKIFCLGLNYLRHIQEGRQPDRPAASYPTLFAKFADSLCGPADDIELPAESDSVDWEAELVVVLGRSVRNADDASAVDAIAGYAVGNDVSMRDWQKRTSEWLQGKAWEKATPVGPLITSDEVTDDGRPDLRIQCAIDGTVVHEKIYHDAGSDTPQETTVAELRQLIAEAGRVPVERDTLYHEVVRTDGDWRTGRALSLAPV